MFSDRFVDLSPNSIDAMLKVSGWHDYFSICGLLYYSLLWNLYISISAWWGPDHHWIREWANQVSLFFMSAAFDWGMIVHYVHWYAFPIAFIILLLLFLSLVGILPNRVIQPIAEHSEYPIERLGNSQFLQNLNLAVTLGFSDLHVLTLVLIEHNDPCRQLHLVG